MNLYILRLTPVLPPSFALAYALKDEVLVGFAVANRKTVPCIATELKSLRFGKFYPSTRHLETKFPSPFNPHPQCHPGG